MIGGINGAMSTQSMQSMYGATGPSRAGSTTSVNLPNAKDVGLTGPNGEGASVEVSISPQARAMLTVDMQSLAAKGYSKVDIDTDGKPGAEISIDLSNVKPGTAAVAVVTTDGVSQTASDLGANASATEGVAGNAQPGEISDEDKLTDLLLKYLEERNKAEQSLMKTASETPALPQGTETVPATEAAPAAGPAPLVSIAVKAYSAMASMGGSSSATSGVSGGTSA